MRRSLAPQSIRSTVLSNPNSLSNSAVKSPLTPVSGAATPTNRSTTSSREDGESMVATPIMRFESSLTHQRVRVQDNNAFPAIEIPSEMVESFDEEGETSFATTASLDEDSSVGASESLFRLQATYPAHDFVDTAVVTSTAATTALPAQEDEGELRDDPPMVPESAVDPPTLRHEKPREDPEKNVDESASSGTQEKKVLETPLWRMLRRSGVRRTERDGFVLTTTSSVFQLRAKEILKRGGDDLLSACLEELVQFFDDDGKTLLEASSPCAREMNSESAVQPSNPSLVQLLLCVEPLQSTTISRVLDVFLALTILDDSAGHSSEPKKLLSSLRWMEASVVDAESLTDQLLSVVEVLGDQLNPHFRDVMSILPEIIPESTHAKVATKLIGMLKSTSRDFAAPLIDVLSVLNLSSILTQEAITVCLEVLRVAPVRDIPVALRFLINASSNVDVLARLNLVKRLRNRLDFLDTEKGMQEEVLILKELEYGVMVHSEILTTFLSMVKTSIEAEKLHVIDGWILFLAMKSGNHANASKTALSLIKQVVVKLGVAVFDASIVGHSNALIDTLCPSLLETCGLLLSNPDGENSVFASFASYLYALLFQEFDDPKCRQEIVQSLVVRVSISLNKNEIDWSIASLESMLNKDPKHLVPFSSMVRSVLYQIDRYDRSQVRRIFRICAKLALLPSSTSPDSQDNEDAGALDDLKILLRKHSSSPDIRKQIIGIAGTLQLIVALAERNDLSVAADEARAPKTTVLASQRMSAPRSHPNLPPWSAEYEPSVRNAATTTSTTSVRVHQSIEEARALLSDLLQQMRRSAPGVVSCFLFEEISRAAEQNLLHTALTRQLNSDLTRAFCKTYLISSEHVAEEENSTTSVTFEPWFDLAPSSSAGGFRFNVFPMVVKGQADSARHREALVAACAILRCLVSTGEAIIDDFDAVLAAPMILPSRSVVQTLSEYTVSDRDAVCSAFHHAVNLTRELCSCFSASTSPKTQRMVSARLEHLVVFESCLATCLEHFPQFQPSSGPSLIVQKDKGSKSAAPRSASGTIRLDEHGEEESEEELEEEGRSSKRRRVQAPSLSRIALMDSSFPVIHGLRDLSPRTIAILSYPIKGPIEEVPLSWLRALTEHVMLASLTARFQVSSKQRASNNDDALPAHSMVTSSRALEYDAEELVVLFSSSGFPHLRPHLDSLIERLTTAPREMSEREEADAVAVLVAVSKSVRLIAQHQALRYSTKGAAALLQCLRAFRVLGVAGGSTSEPNAERDAELIRCASLTDESPPVATDVGALVAQASRSAIAFFTDRVSLSGALKSSPSAQIDVFHLLVVLVDLAADPASRDALSRTAKTLLARDWWSERPLTKSNVEILLHARLEYASDPTRATLETIQELVRVVQQCKAIEIEDEENIDDEDANSRGAESEARLSQAFPFTLTRRTLGSFYACGLSSLTRCVEKEPMTRCHEICEGFSQIVNLTKDVDTLGESLLRDAVRHGRAFLDVVCKRVLPEISKTFQADRSSMAALLTVQRATRQLQQVCQHAKLKKDAVALSAMPGIRKSMEVLLMGVKGMFVEHGVVSDVWKVGNLKIRNVDGSERRPEDLEESAGGSAEDEEDQE